MSKAPDLVPESGAETERSQDGEPSGASSTVAALEHARIYVAEMTVRHFRGIEYCRVEFHPEITLLAGPNNIGKSRLLRALGIALGHLPADRDDWTMDASDEPSIDVILAPFNPASGSEIFDDREGQLLRDVYAVSDDPDRERFAWRTRIRRSNEGLGVRTDQTVLTFDVGSEQWQEPTNWIDLDRNQRRLVACDLVDAGRDLVADIARRGSPIRRIMDDLEIPDDKREALEERLSVLGVEIVEHSAALSSVRQELELLGQYVETVGSASVQPIPPRLEEVGRSISIEFDTGSGSVPIRYHGSGARSLAALQTQGVMYAKRLGRDGPAVLPHPVSLIEEPEAHLHPQAQFDLAELMNALQGQVIASTHSSHLVSVVDPEGIRVLHGRDGGLTAKHLIGEDGSKLDAREVEKLKRMIERPFGELLYASAIVIVEGATERALLPPLIRHRLGAGGHGVCVVDSGGLEQQYATAIVKFAQRMGVPWLLVADTDAGGRNAADRLLRDHGDGDMNRLIWIASDEDKCVEDALLEFSTDLCEAAFRSLGYDGSGDLREFMSQHKGSYGRSVAMELLKQRPWPIGDENPVEPWPSAIVELVTKLQTRQQGDGSNG